MINNIEEAIARMEQAVAAMDARRDRRAVFLYAYLLITYNVRDRIRAGWFFDGEWLSRLAGKFARLYFESLEAYDAGGPLPEAWKLTHDRVVRDRASVVENLALGINAHINYDLAFGIAENILEHGDQASEERLLRRKFDHDRVNEVLARSTDQIQREVPRRYRSVIPIIDILFGPFDEYVALAGLKAYRENVWSNVRYLLLAQGGADRDRVVAKIRDEAVRAARTVIAAASPFGRRFADRSDAEVSQAGVRRGEELPVLLSTPFDFRETLSAAARGAVPGLATTCVIELSDGKGGVRDSVSHPASAHYGDAPAGMSGQGGRERHREPVEQAGDSTVAEPLVSPGGCFGSVLLIRDGGGVCAEAEAGGYALLASAALEAAAVGQALREECARMREVYGERVGGDA